MGIVQEEAGRGPLREAVYLQLRRAIIEGELKPGDPLGEISIAQQFRTSRSPVREALGRLEQEGYLVRKSNGRGIVAPLDKSELWNLYQVRAAVEGLAARLATPYLTGLAIESMEGHLNEMREHALAQDVEASLRAGGNFHDILLDHCPNKPLREIVELVRTRIQRYRQLVATLRDREVRVGEHRAILRALSRRDELAAEAAMQKHILRSAEDILKS